MSSSSHRYTKSSIAEHKQRIAIPIRQLSNHTHAHFIEQHSESPVYSNETTTQWIHDSISGRQKFRMKINIEGFNRNDVHTRVDGNKFFVHGERIENKSQGTSKKIIEKSYELPPDVDKSSPHVTFPSPATMQVDFPSKHSSPRSNQSSEYISSRKLNTNDLYDRKVIAHSHSRSPQHEMFHDNQSSAIPIQRIAISSRDSSVTPAHTHSQIYRFREPTNHPVIDKTGPVQKQILKKIHRRRATPIVGFQSSHNNGHDRSLSPALSSIIEEDSMTSSSSSSSSNTDSTISNNESHSSHFPRDFDSKAFYRSVFQPEIFTDDRHQRYIEMRLDVRDYKPDEMKVSINENDLIVQVHHTTFYKRITLPSNADLSSLSLHYHHDKKLYITVKLLDAHSSFKYI